jgi:putative membrane protein insertion efficiency factor
MGDRCMAAKLTSHPFPEPDVEPNSKRKPFQGLLSSSRAGWAPRGRFAPPLAERTGPPGGFTLLALGSLRLYRFALSPLLHALFGSACRFEPSCSRFAADAIRDLGLGRGAALTIKRLARCHPLGGHGYDPVPAAGHSRKK